MRKILNVYLARANAPYSEAYADLDLPASPYELLDFERIGREARIGECGVFTKQGYVVQHTELNEAFQTLDLTLKQPDYQILMELTDSGFLGLPQTALPDTQPRRCLDCRIPLLSGAFDSVKDIEILNGFAEKLSTMTGKEILRYKAVLTATECGDLQSAVSLLDNLDHYMLDTKISSPEDAALSELNFIAGDNDMERLQQYVNLPAYGRDLLERDNAVITPYGHMARDDFRPILAPFEEPTLGGMEML
ncbi:MAG: hypothetical protein ACOX67_01405 [Oscillospiraceae bacterium]